MCWWMVEFICDRLPREQGGPPMGVFRLAVFTTSAAKARDAAVITPGFRCVETVRGVTSAHEKLLFNYSTAREIF